MPISRADFPIFSRDPVETAQNQNSTTLLDCLLRFGEGGTKGFPNLLNPTCSASALPS